MSGAPSPSGKARTPGGAAGQAASAAEASRATHSTNASNLTRAENIPAIERATGRSWDSWVKLFEAAGAAKLPHAEIAKIAHSGVPDDLRNPFWWAQGIAIAYEQHAGLRVPGQSSTGTFRVSASRTLPLDRDAAIAAWRTAHGARADHLGHTAGEPRSSRTEKRSFWRFSLDGAGKVEVSATPKGDDRVILGVSHDSLPDGDRIEAWRAHWKSLLTEL